MTRYERRGLQGTVQFSLIPLVLFFGAGTETRGNDGPTLCSTIIPVDSPADLDAIRNNLDGCYRQTANIDLTGYALLPIGDETAAFTGLYDGNGFSISNFTYDGFPDNCVGLFGVADSNSTIKNVKLQNVFVTGWKQVGGLVGLLQEGSCILDSSISGTVQGLNEVGGMVGRAFGASVFRSSANVAVAGIGGGNGALWAGGLVGHCHPGTLVRDSSASGSVNGSANVGGLVGNHHGSTIVNCTATGPVTSNTWTGGLVGYCQEDFITGDHLWTEVIDSAASGKVLAVGSGLPGSCGGLIGYMEPHSRVINSSAKGNAESTFIGFSATGGLIGFAETDCEIEDSYAQGDAIGAHPVAGLVGWCDSDIIRCHASGDASGEWSVGGLVAHTGSVAGILVSDSYATGDVFASGAPNGHADPGNLLAAAGGLAGYVFPGCFIQDSYATGCVTSTGEQTGGLCGFFWDSDVSGCYATGEVESTEIKLGGLIGNMRVASFNGTPIGEGLVENCYARGDVISTATLPEDQGKIGGLIGGIESSPAHGLFYTIRYCYSTGFVNLDHPTAGGLIGYAGSGTVVTDCHWDTETSGQDTSAGGPGAQGNTTAEMMIKATYVNWPFGTVWIINEGQSYPFLRWQSAPPPPGCQLP